MTLKKTSVPDLKLIDELVFKPCNLGLKNIEAEAESHKYAAHRFQLNEKQIIFRVAKITPTKTGQFVSIWKRNREKITAPFDVDDDFDLLIILTQTPTNLGVFIFPKAILHHQLIISGQEKVGKRGMRVYPTWDETASKQAQKAQAWQTGFFLDFSDSTKFDLNRAKKLLVVAPSGNNAITS